MAETTLRFEESKGLRRIAAGAGLGLAGGVAAIVAPVAIIWFVLYAAGGFLVWNSVLLEVTGILLLAGAILFLLSFIVYRRGFAHLRKIDRRFSAAAILCIVGALGFLLVVVVALVLLNSSGSIVQCLHGRPTQVLSCLRSGEPLGAYTGLIGFWMAWLGALGLVVGTYQTGRRYHRGSVSVGAALYTILILLLVGPFVALFFTVPGAQYIFLLLPVLVVLAPGLVVAGSYAALPASSASSSS